MLLGAPADVVLTSLCLVPFVTAGIFGRKPKQTPPPSQGETPDQLAAAGRFREAAEAATRAGDHAAAVAYFRRAGSWIGAADAARQAGQAAMAGTLYERAGAPRLALEAYESAGCDGDSARVAAQTGDARLLARVAARLVQRGDLSVAAELFRRAGQLSDAEKCYRALPHDGLARAVEMYLGEVERALGAPPLDASVERIVRRAADILDEIGRADEAAELWRQVGLEPPRARTASRPSRRSSGAIRVAPPPRDEDLSIESPITSADALFPAASEEDLSIESPITSPEVFAPKRDDGGSVTEADPKPPSFASVGETLRPVDTSVFGDEATERYEILRALGVGGMGEVYTARDRKLGRVVALKLLSRALVGHARAMDMFHREARAAAALNHPGIVTIYDLGVLDGRPFISMELLDGSDLEAISRAKGPFPHGPAAEIAARVADALEFAHARGVIHRDIKPANIVLSPKGNVTVLDFGLAKAVDGGAQAASIVAGTPDYMAPEQIAKGLVDGRTDVFSLGVVLYRLLTCERPFARLDRSSPVRPPSAVVAGIAPELDAAVMRAIDPRPENRFQRALDMAMALRAYVSG